MVDPNPSSSLPNLFCAEEKSCLNENNDDDDDKIPPQSQPLPCFDLEYEDDYIKSLVQRERLSNFGSINSSGSSSWLKDARLSAVNWILNAQTLLGFHHQTSYLSVTYFDRFLSIKRIQEDQLWVIRLLSIACLRLAVKMEECRVPTLSEYPLDDDYRFDRQVIRRMELLVLSTLEWKLSLITPFPYLHYLAKKFDDQGANHLDYDFISRAMDLVMTIIKEMNLMERRPSVIAVAAVLAARDLELTQDELKVKLNTVSSWEASENGEEELFACYSLMQRLATNGNLSTPSNTDVDQTLCATTSTVGAKRRLTFDDSDENPNSADKIQRR